jgi:nucleoside-diphosphate-sugar epimerase
MKKHFIKNKKIVIIGGAGFIGHNLSLELKKLRANITVIDNLKVNNLYSLNHKNSKFPFPKLTKKIVIERLRLLKKNKIKIYKTDARDHKKLHLVLNKIKPNVIIHLAAVSHANKSNIDPHTSFDNSLRTLENSLDYAKNKIEHFVFLSSSMVYGDFKKKIVLEKDICSPKGIYAGLKFSAEQIIKSYGQIFNLPYTIIRPSALYGERCISRRVGQIFIENAINNVSLTVGGDGNEKLDFTYIKDLIQGIICVLKSKKSIQETFNLTYGNSRSINTMLTLLKKEFPNIQVNYVKRDKFMPVRGTLSNLKAKKLLNYSPRWNLEKGYIRYIKWYKKIFAAS